MSGAARQGVSRISVSLPEHLVTELDAMVAQRGFESRSQAIAEMIQKQLAEHREELGQDIMAGTINLVYDHSVRDLQQHLRELQLEYIDEVISSLSVNLLQSKTLEVILVQGPAARLQTIANRMIACRGVTTGRLLMSAAILPPVHPLPASRLG